jgi:hypothetical protein
VDVDEAIDVAGLAEPLDDREQAPGRGDACGAHLGGDHARDVAE